MRILVAVAAGVLIAAPAMAQQMNAELFTQRATKLEKRGPAALLSMGEIKTLAREAEGAMQLAKQNRARAVQAGRPAEFCPPSEMTLNNKEFMRLLRAIPQVERRSMNMRDAVTRILAAKYPCPR